MSEQQTGAEGASENNNEQQQEQQQEFTAITSQADFDKAISARLARERAKYDNFDTYKAAADELQALKDAQKTETQKAQDALTKAQQELAQERAARLRAQVAATKGVPEELLSGSTQDELEASAEKLLAFKGAEPKGPVIPNQGKTPVNGPSADDWLRSAVSG